MPSSVWTCQNTRSVQPYQWSVQLQDYIWGYDDLNNTVTERVSRKSYLYRPSWWDWKGGSSVIHFRWMMRSFTTDGRKEHGQLQEYSDYATSNAGFGYGERQKMRTNQNSWIVWKPMLRQNCLRRFLIEFPAGKEDLSTRLLTWW